MANFGGGRWVRFVSLFVVAGCTRSAPSEAVAKRSEALTPGPSFTLQLPPQLTTGGAGLTASTALTLGDRVQIKQATGSLFAGVVNLGSGQTLLGRDDKTGDLWSLGSVQLQDRAAVSGFLKTAGTLTRGTGTTITGVIQQGQPLTPPSLVSVVVQFQNGASTVTVANDSTRSLGPGDYAAINLGARSILALSTGDYRVDSLATQPGSKLRLTTTAGPIRFFVRTTLNWNSTVAAAAGDPTKLLMGYVGTAAITINTPFTGTLLSPSAAVTLPTVSSPHLGAFFAKGITAQPDVVVATQPFQTPCQGVVTDDGNACTTDACDPVTGLATHVPVGNGTTCSDGNACTQTDTCQAGTCVGASPVSCTALDQCHSAGTCAPTTGLCSSPAKANGASCSDGNACTLSDTCQAGACVGASPVTCVAQDQCHAPGACNSATGVCSNPAKANGTSCSDGSACTQSDSCQSGTCVGTSPVLCSALDQCHIAGTCDASSGVCSNPVKSNGSTCSDGNACTQTDSCQAGACIGATAVTCAAQDQCHVAGTCAPATGLCSQPSKADGSTCNDGNSCTVADACQAGACVGGSAVVCTAQDQCHAPGTCSAATGLCSNPIKANGSACSDGNSCTQSDACQAGACVGSNPVVCVAQDQCHVAGSCSSSSGTCSNPIKTNGTACNDSNACTAGDVCSSGLCQPGSAVASDDGNPCTADSCDPILGTAHVALADGTSCTDGNSCNGSETCQQSSCTAGTLPILDDSNPCTADSCDPALGVVHAPVAFGTSCSDGNPCNGAEVCSGFGQCGAGTPLALDDGNPCTADACDPTGGITHLPVAAGLSCADGNLCNGDERCDAMGTCLPSTPLTVDDGNVCTLDSCDALAGVLHTPIAGCNPDAGQPSQPFETRASIMGRVIDGGGSPVSAFTAEVFNDRLDTTARTDVVTTINPDGTFRIRLSTFPESANQSTQPQHVLIRIASETFPSLLRSAYLRPGDVVALGDLTTLARDPNVTVIGPEGGTAQDSQGTLSLQIPPGALSQLTPVRLTPIPVREQFPAPLPSNTVTMYGMEIEPTGTVLAVPATLRIKNTLNLPTTMKIPVGTIDAQYGDWAHEGFASWDGTRFSTTISHFSPHDCNGPQLGELVAFIGEGPGRNKGNGKDCGVGSSTRYANGGLEQSFDVPLQSAAGHDYSMSLSYTSELSGSVAVGNGPTHVPVLNQEFARSFASQNIRLGCVVGKGTSASCPGGGGSSGGKPCLTLVGGIGIAGYSLSQHLTLFDSDVAKTQAVVPANTQDIQQAFYAPLPNDASGNPARSGYTPLHMATTVSVGGAGACVGSGAGFGVSANFGASAPLRLPLNTGNLVDFPAYQLVVHRRGSPVGAGWSFNELGTLYRAPDGASADIVHGDGQQETFHPYPFLRKVVDFQNSSDLSFAVDGQTSELFAASSNLGIRQLNVQTGAFTSVAAGSLFGGPLPVDFKVTYVAGQRRFLGATFLGIFEIGSDGSTRQLATFGGTNPRVPAVAGVGKYAYFAADQNATGTADGVIVQRIDLTDPNRTITTLSAASGGDLRLDPHGQSQAQAFQFLHPIGLAPAFDGGLYVADDRRNAVYHLAPDDAGEVAPDSNVTRILGSGIDTTSGGLGRNLPALEMAIRGPSQLTVAPDGTLFVAARDIGGLAAYDPFSQTGHWVAFDSTSNLAGTDSGGTLSQITLRAGSLAPLAKDSVLVPYGGLALLLTTPLSSQFEPLRTLTFSDTGATVVDASADVIEQYTWGNPNKTEAPLSAETLRSGEPIRSIAYKDLDHVDYIQDAAGGRVAFAYDGSGHLSTITDPAQRVTRFTIDSDANLREVIYPSGEARRFDYQDYRMVAATHPNGEVSTYTYAADGTLQTAQRPGGGTTTIQAAQSGGPKYDSSGHVYYESQVTDDRGVQHALRVDNAGGVVWDKYTADGQAYDVENLYASALNGANAFETTTNRLLRFANTTVNGLPTGPMRTFDAMGRVINVTQSPSSFTTLLTPSYDDTLRLSKLGFGTTVDWGYTYDAAGHLTKVADQFPNQQNAETGRRTTYASFRAADGQPTTVTSHGIPTTFSYDALGLVSQAVDTVGRSLSVVHDAAGNATAVNDGSTTIQYGFDLAGRVNSITDAENNTTQLSYETAGCSCSNGDRVTSIATPDLPTGQRWSLTYDADGDLQTTTTPLGEQEVYTHDAQRDLVGVIDRAGRATTFTYDQLGRQATITDPVQRLGVFSYAVPTSTQWQGPTLYAQSPTSSRAPTSLTATLADGQYQVGTNGIRPGADTSHVALYRDATFQSSQWLAMDALDRLQLRTDRSASGLPFDSATPGPSSPGNVSVPFIDESYDYKDLFSDLASPWPLPFLEATHDLNGNQLSTPSGILGRNPDFDVTSVGSFLGVSLPSFGNALTVSRDVAGRLTGVSRAFSPASSQITYLPNGRLGSVTVTTPVLDSSYTGAICDQPGQTCSTACSHRCLVYFQSSATALESFGYDDRGLLKARSTPGGDFQYSYDSVGRNIRLVYPDGHERDQIFDALGRLTSRCYLYSDGTTPNHCYTATYDAVGNPKILTDPELREEITYDTLDRVTEVRRYVPATATVVSATETYAYNALGGFSVYDGVAVDDQRARLDGAGKASAAIPATFQGAPVVMDGGGSVTSFGQVSLQYFNFGHHVKTLAVGGPQATTQTYNYDVLGRLVGAHIGPPSGLRPNHDENYIYSDLSSSISASVITPYNVTVPPENPSIPNTDWSVGYDGVDHPLWVRTLAPRSGNSNTQIIYPELDTLGNVRHLYAVGSASDPTFKRDLGSHGYSAFGKAIAISGGVTGADIPFGWQGKRLIAPNLYDSRARVWSADLGAFLQADEYGFLTHSGTLWSWPGQNPFKYRDPSGRDASEWFLNNTSWIDDAAPALAAAGAESEVPGLAQVGEAALLAIRAIDALSSLEAQRQSAAAIAKATSDEENECKVEGAPPPNLSPEGARRAGAFNEAKRQNGIPTSQQPESTGPNLDRRGDPQPGKQYTFRDPNGKEIIIRDDAEGHYYGDGDPQNRGPHFNDPAGNHYDY